MTDKAKRAWTAAGWFGGWALFSAWLGMVAGWSVLLLTSAVACMAVAGLRPLGVMLWHGVYFLGKRSPHE